MKWGGGEGLSKEVAWGQSEVWDGPSGEPEEDDNRCKALGGKRLQGLGNCREASVAGAGDGRREGWGSCGVGKRPGHGVQWPQEEPWLLS